MRRGSEIQTPFRYVKGQESVGEGLKMNAMRYPWAAAVILCAAAPVLHGQTNAFDKPPAGVEDALRARVAKFYQAFVDGKYRKADEVVAEECKDEFFAAKKSRFNGFHIDQVIFEENFTKARVVTLVDVEVAMVSEKMAMKAPQTTLWRLENGEWWWYIYKNVDEVDTPFGKVRRPRNEDVKDTPPAAMQPISMAALAHMVKPEKETIQMSGTKSSAQTVKIMNEAPGPVTLGVRPITTPGLTAKLDRTDVSAHGSAALSISYTPGKNQAAGPAEVQVITFPSNSVITVKVEFTDK